MPASNQPDNSGKRDPRITDRRTIDPRQPPT